MNEAHLSTKRTETGQDPRFPQADVDQGWAGGDPVAPGEGTPAALGVTAPRPEGRNGSLVGPVRSRRTFEELRRSSSRGRSGPLAVSVVMEPTWSEVKFAYAVNRRVGNAVKRNRLKRRLRAIVSEQAAHLPAGAYLVHAGPGGPLLGFDQLKVAMSQAVERATAGSARRPAVGPTPQRGAPR
jgi:ribonuclease P protein component